RRWWLSWGICGAAAPLGKRLESPGADFRQVLGRSAPDCSPVLVWALGESLPPVRRATARFGRRRGIASVNPEGQFCQCAVLTVGCSVHAIAPPSWAPGAAGGLPGRGAARAGGK